MIDALAECSINSKEGQRKTLPVSPIKVNNSSLNPCNFLNFIYLIRESDHVVPLYFFLFDNQVAMEGGGSIWKSSAYNVGGLILTLDDIEHGILRGNRLTPATATSRKTYFSEGI